MRRICAYFLKLEVLLKPTDMMSFCRQKSFWGCGGIRLGGRMVPLPVTIGGSKGRWKNRVRTDLLWYLLSLYCMYKGFTSINIFDKFFHNFLYMKIIVTSFQGWKTSVFCVYQLFGNKPKLWTFCLIFLHFCIKKIIWKPAQNREKVICAAHKCWMKYTTQNVSEISKTKNFLLN